MLPIGATVVPSAKATRGVEPGTRRTEAGSVHTFGSPERHRTNGFYDTDRLMTEQQRTLAGERPINAVKIAVAEPDGFRTNAYFPWRQSRKSHIHHLQLIRAINQHCCAHR
jgi:hypothetical protein